MARVHGHALQRRWDGAAWPPVHSAPPQAGMPALERNHAFHCKMTPGVFLGARCNHDLSILLRLPVLNDRRKTLFSNNGDTSMTSKEKEEAEERRKKKDGVL